MNGQPPELLAQTPILVVGVMVPLPLLSEVLREVIVRAEL